MFPASGLILLPMTEPWLHPTGQLASPRARDCCPERSEEANRKHNPARPHCGFCTSPHTCAAGRRVVLAVCPGTSPRGFLLGTWLDPSPSPAWPWITRKETFEDASPALMPPTILTVDPCVWGQIPSLCHVCAVADNERGGEVWGVQGVMGEKAQITSRRRQESETRDLALS